MNCKRTSIIQSYGINCYKITEEFSGKYVYIPAKEAFEYIRFRMDPLEGNGDRMADAYQKAGADYWRLLPEDYIFPCIKKIYKNFKIVNAQRIEVFQPFGNWVFEEACNCLHQYNAATERMNIGDGFIVPNSEEQTCIAERMISGSMNFAGALYTCAPDISYPTQSYGMIEDTLRGTNYSFWDAIYDAHSQWKAQSSEHGRIAISDGLVVPSSDEIAEIEIGLNSGMTLTQAYFNIANDILPPESMIKCIEDKIKNTSSTWLDIFKSCQGGNKTLYYVIGGALALLLLSR